MISSKLNRILYISRDIGSGFIERLKMNPLSESKRRGIPEPYCRDCSRYTAYCMVEDQVWDDIVKDDPKDMILCFQCMQSRLGRDIKLSDLKAVPCNEPFFLGKLMN